MKDAAYALAVARLKLMKRGSAGLLAQIGYGLDHKPDASLPTLATNGKEVLYNPGFVLALTADELQGVLAHEYAHCALLHPVRRRPDHDPERANVAMDHAVNLMLLESGFTLPNGAHADPAFRGMAWEHIYTLLPEDPKQAGKSDPEPDGDQEADGDDGEGPDGAGDEPMDCPPGKPGDKGGDVRPYPGKDGGPATHAELSQAVAEMTDRVLQIAQAMEQCGKGSEASRRLVSDLTTPRDPDLYEALARLLERAANDHSWKRINRRLLHAGIYPGIDSEECPPLVVAVDTSGSITDRVLAAFQDKIRRAIADFRPRAVTVIYCDSQINADPMTYEPDAFPGLSAIGGGGTDFAPPFRWVDDHLAEAPAALVYLTDLDGPCDAPEPAYPVIWARIPGYRNRTGPWGQTVPINL